VSNEWNFVIAAYALTWVVLAGYALHLRRTVRQARWAYERATGGVGAERTGGSGRAAR
jgi:CcmD family protein